MVIGGTGDCAKDGSDNGNVTTFPKDYFMSHDEREEEMEKALNTPAYSKEDIDHALYEFLKHNGFSEVTGTGLMLKRLEYRDEG